MFIDQTYSRSSLIHGILRVDSHPHPPLGLGFSPQMICAPIWCQPKGVKCLLGLNYQQRNKDGHRGDQSLGWKIMLIRGALGQPNLEMNKEDEDLGSRMPKISIGLDD